MIMQRHHRRHLQGGLQRLQKGLHRRHLQGGLQRLQGGLQLLRGPPRNEVVGPPTGKEESLL